jgi:antitoxin (DNA-binding transcriptional repressor) of toxin-antitoxin stability system
MRAMGIKTLKNRLSEYVRAAAAGETVLVTDRDRVVAELGPPQPGRSATIADALIAQAVRDGWLRPPVVTSRVRPVRHPVTTLTALLEQLAADRSDR